MLKMLEQKQTTEFSFFVVLHVTVKKEILRTLLWKSDSDFMAVTYVSEHTNLSLHFHDNSSYILVMLYAHCLLCSF
jgi:hypothetical protein